MWVAVALPPRVVAQCPGGSCPVPSYRVSTPPSKAFCRLHVGHGLLRSGGSGVAISSNGRATAILTARHVVGKVGVPVEATFPDGTRLTGQAAVLCADADVAVVVVNGRAPALVKIAPDVPASGMPMWFGGFDGSAGWRAVPTRIVGRAVSGDWFLAGGARPGDSGGPVWIEDGLVGIVWGTDGQRTVCTSLPQLATFFESGRYIFPWNAWLEDRRDARSHGESPQSQPMPRAPAPAPEPQPTPPPTPAPIPPVLPPDLTPRIEALEGKVGQLETKVGQLESRVAAIGSQVSTVERKATAAEAAAAEAKQKAEEWRGSTLRDVTDYLWRVLPIGWGVQVAIVLVALAVFLWRDIQARKRSGDLLEIEKFLRGVAARTPTPLDDWLVEKLTQALDRVIPRPTASEQVSTTKRGKSA